MATINIGAENAGDPHYRYKMPKPISKVEGRGNGIKTNVVNNVDIAKALERPPEYILKFLGCELGAQTNFDSKTGTSIVNGAHDANVLMALMEAFIKKYVQCYSCGNPETVISIKRDYIYLKCKACGYVSDVDMGHKLNNFILKNPPKAKESKAEKLVRKQEKERLKALKAEKDKDKEKDKKDKSKKKNKGSVDVDAEGLRQSSKSIEETPQEGGSSEKLEEKKSAKESKQEDDDIVWHSDVSAEAIAKRAEEQLTSSAVASMVTQGNIEAEASEAKKKLKKVMTKLEFSEDVIASLNELGALFYKDAAIQDIVEFLSNASTKAAIRMMMLYIVLFWEAPEKLGSIVKQKASMLRQFSKTPKDQLAQLFGLEYVMAMMIPERMKEYPQILKVIYDEDVVEEEIIVGWYEQPALSQKALGITEEGGKEVRKVCEAFVEWLQEEDEEDEESDEEEDEDE